MEVIGKARTRMNGGTNQMTDSFREPSALSRQTPSCTSAANIISGGRKQACPQRSSFGNYWLEFCCVLC